jgi:hypothetical protein
VSDASRLARRQLRRRTPLPEHGTRVRYQLGCHCTPCSAANTAYELAWERGVGPRPRALVDAKQARRRVRQLLIEGFTVQMIAQEIGIRRLRAIGRFITKQRHDALEALYQRRVAE